MMLVHTLRNRPGRVANLIHSGLCSALCTLLLIAAGCGGPQKTESGDSAAGATGAQSPAREDDIQRMLDERISDLDRRYVLGPTAADSFGYRIVWNREPTARFQGSLEHVTIAGDSILVIDDANNLARILRENGAVTWIEPVAGPADVILGVRRVPYGTQDAVLVLTEGDVHIFNTNNGVQIGRQTLSRVASTAPTVAPPVILYGALNGTAIWHHYGFGTYVDGYSLEGAVAFPPQIVDSTVIVTTSAGHVMALDLETRSQLWSAFTRDVIHARPAVTHEAVYVTSEDQFIRCYNLITGQVVWSRLHSRPLRESPVAIGDRVYVQTPDQGLCCYEAFSFEDLDGELYWTNPRIRGTVVGRHQQRLLAWDSGGRKLTVFDELTGDISREIPLPKVRTLLLTGFDSGEIYAIGDDGTITRAQPRTR